MPRRSSEKVKELSSIDHTCKSKSIKIILGSTVMEKIANPRGCLPKSSLLRRLATMNYIVRFTLLLSLYKNILITQFSNYSNGKEIPPFTD